MRKAYEVWVPQVRKYVVFASAPRSAVKEAVKRARSCTSEVELCGQPMVKILSPHGQDEEDLLPAWLEEEVAISNPAHRVCRILP